jgi:MFS family permease
MSPKLPLGALAERNFRLLFSSNTISGVGDGISTVALAFAVLEISDSAIALGVVLAARQVMEAGIVLAAGVWSDRLPRHVILLAAAVVMGAAQATTAILVLSSAASVPILVGLQAVYGLAEGFVVPASTGLIPATVSPERLQEANALLGLSRNATWIVGPALGGALVTLGSPGAALLVDAGTFAAGAILLLPMRLPGRADVIESKPFFHELREGWDEFRRQTWLWTTIVFFGLGNFAFASYFVLAPVIAKRELGGAPAWAAATTAWSTGALLGGLVALRFRPRKPLAASCMAAWLIIPAPLAFGLGLPLAVIVPCAVLGGVGIAIHLALWFTVFQQQVPAESMSRVSSYDAFGSIVLGPFGAALAGPFAALVGVHAALLGAVVVMALTEAIVYAQPSVHAIRAPKALEPEPA